MNAGDARIFDGKIITETKEKITKLGLDNSAAELLPTNTVCLSRTGASIGYTVILGKPIATNQGFVNYICSEFLLPKFLMHIFLFERTSIISYGEGTAYKTVYFPEAKGFHIIFPPINEQKRIVSKIEELFSKIDSTKQSMEHTKLQLEQYRSSLLKSAFEGKLTEKWREQNKDNIQEIPNNDQLPFGWIKTTVNELSTKEKTAIRMGPFGSSLKKHELVNSGIRVLWIENIVNNKFEYKSGKFITKEKFQQLSGFRVKANDILVTMMGTIGRTAIVPNDIGTAIISSHLLKISVEPSICISKFLTLSLRGNPHVLKQLERKASGVVMKGLNTKIIKNIELSLPSLEEQKEIISQIEQGFSLIDNTSQMIHSTLQKLQTMKISVLKQAFEGKLVPQDPNDEPASVLLEKIKAK
jgi:type I restriction enzyme S subunit